MPDRERVIKGLEACEYENCTAESCPYATRAGCVELLFHDALILLREQKPVEPIKKPGIVEPYKCGACEAVLGWESEKQRFCPNCGRKVKWDAGN